MNTSMSRGLKHWFDWYAAEKPSWERSNGATIPGMTHREQIAINQSSAFIVNTLRTEALDRGERDPHTTTQEVFENHLTWVRGLVEGQLKLWDETPRS